MSVPAVTSLVIYKGTDFEKKVSIALTTLAGTETITAKIRKHETSSTSYSFDTYIDTTNNAVVISMGNSVTDDLTEGRNYFDIISQNSSTNKIMKLVEGSIIVNQTVSS
jgi:hypothetical protein